jgi:hypothetical protein
MPIRPAAIFVARSIKVAGKQIIMSARGAEAATALQTASI